MDLDKIPHILKDVRPERLKQLHEYAKTHGDHLRQWSTATAVGSWVMIRRSGSAHPGCLRSMLSKAEQNLGGTKRWRFDKDPVAAADPLYETDHDKKVGYIPGSAIKVGDVWLGWCVNPSQLSGIRVCARRDLGDGAWSHWYYSEKPDGATLRDHIKDAVSRTSSDLFSREDIDDLLLDWQAETLRRRDLLAYGDPEYVVRELIHRQHGQAPAVTVSDEMRRVLREGTYDPTKIRHAGTATAENRGRVHIAHSNSFQPVHTSPDNTDSTVTFDEAARVEAAAILEAHKNVAERWRELHEHAIPNPVVAADHSHTPTTDPESDHQESNMTDTDTAESPLKDFMSEAKTTAMTGLKYGAAKAVADEAVIALVNAVDNPFFRMIMANRVARSIGGIVIAGGLGVTATLAPGLFGKQAPRVRAVSLAVLGGYGATEGAELMKMGMERFVKPVVGRFLDAAKKRGMGDDASTPQLTDDPLAGFSDVAKEAAKAAGAYDLGVGDA